MAPPTDPSPTPAAGVRRRVRDEMRRTILDAARDHLARRGASDLSLRAIARDVGLVSSAVYRYVPSRDALLTELIIESYDSLGEAGEQADAAVERGDLVGRFVEIGRAVRSWGVEHPHEWALIYGSPVIGYAAPQDTIRAASRIPTLLAEILRDARAAGVSLPEDPVNAADERALAPIHDFFGPDVPVEAAARGLMSWTYVVGAVSAEVFGQRQNVVVAEEAPAFFEGEMRRMAGLMGL